MLGAWILGLPGQALAADSAPARYAAADTVWVLLGAALVFFMQPGFAMVETGLTRAKKKAVIAAGRDAFCGAVERHIDRVSGLPRLCMQDQ